MELLCDIDSEIVSVFQAAFEEARRHRWIESEKRGYDLGESAFLDWYEQHWNIFVRYRHVEHLIGERRWPEFGRRSFGVLRHAMVVDWLTCEIVDRYQAGGENLDIINWAMDEGHDSDAVFECLEVININDARLNPRFRL